MANRLTPSKKVNFDGNFSQGRLKVIIRLSLSEYLYLAISRKL